MAIVKKSTNKKCWRGGEEKETLLHYWWDWKTGVGRVPKKIKSRITIWSSNPTPGQRKTIIWKNMWTPMFIAALFIIAMTWKQPKCPSTEEWIKKIWYIYSMEFFVCVCVCAQLLSHVWLFEILLSHKKEWNCATCRDMDGLETIIQSEIT